MEILINLPESCFKSLQDGLIVVGGQQNGKTLLSKLCNAVLNGTPLPAGHGDLVDLSKINEDRTTADNPIIYLSAYGRDIEAVSLDYLDELPVMIPADNKEKNNEL